jgi:citrate lyase subunit beta / citryl-CoA lyase
MTTASMRSVLYMPGSNQRAMDKARSLPADCIVFDLEDAVSPEAKALARQQVVAQLGAGGYGSRRLVVRCNGLETPWGEEDVAAIAGSAADVLCLPKIESAGQLAAIQSRLQQAGRNSMPLWPMIETPLGVEAAAAIAEFPSVEALVMGTTDLSSMLRIPATEGRQGLQYSLARCVLAARARGKAVLDGVYLELDNSEGFRTVCEQGRSLGFDGKTLIHPNQVAVANEVFGPSAEAVEHAGRVLLAWREAQDRGEGLAVLDGKLVEVMHVEDARRLLAMAEQIAQLA